MSDNLRIPKYRKHKQSGQAVVTLTDGLGGRRDVLLGKHGTAASRMEYARVIAEWEATGRRISEPAAADLTISELVKVFWQHVQKHYRRPDGTQTSEVKEYRRTLRVLNYLYGPTPIKDFSPGKLKAVRELMIKGYDHSKYGPQQALARGVINQRIGRIRRLVKWGVANDMVPAGVYHGLLAVSGLQRGRTEARETDPVRPVPRAVVMDTLPALRPILQDMVLLQLETGMRSGELVIMRGIDLEMTGPVWLYRPATHKTQHHGHERVIPIGPKGQEIVRRHLKTDVQAYLFSAADAMTEFRARQRASRKTKVQPSQENRKKDQPRKKPGERYTPGTYGRAIKDAITRHNKKVPADQQLPHWSPHRLRHTRATELRKQFGLDAARAVLGHRSPAITEVYAEIDQAKAMEAMEKLG